MRMATRERPGEGRPGASVQSPLPRIVRTTDARDFARTRGFLMGKLDGRVALITGGARGQGAAEATLFAQEGATVIVTDVLDDDGKKTASAVGGTYMRHDVTDEARWKSVVEEIVAQHGRLDILINNAGIYRPENLLDASQASYRQVIDINQVGVFLGMQAVARPMMEGDGGAIVNIS